MSTTHSHHHSVDIRCFSCQKLLARSPNVGETFHIKCPRCGNLNPIFKDIADQVVVTDVGGRILYANQILEQVTGFSLAEVVGKTPGECWGGQMPETFYRDMWQKIKTNRESVAVKLTNKRKDGTLYQAMLRISPVVGTDNEIKMFIGIETVVH